MSEGQGGLVPPPINAPSAQPLALGVQPGVPPVTRVTEIVITPGSVLEGIFTYSSNPPAAGTLIESAGVSAAGTDAYGNHFVPGQASYSGSFATSVNGGWIQFYSGSLAGGWSTTGAIETDVFGDIALVQPPGRSVITLNVTIDDGAGNLTANSGTFGSLTVAGSGSTQTAGLPNGQIAGTSGAASAGTAHTHGAGSYAVTNGVHAHVF